MGCIAFRLQNLIKKEIESRRLGNYLFSDDLLGESNLYDTNYAVKSLDVIDALSTT